MKYSLVALVILTLALVAYGQTTGNTVLISVGSKSIKLPTPSGYVNAWENYPNLRTAFEINETENNQMLAMYSPLSAIPALDGGKYLGFPRYTKVSVSKRLADIDFSEAQFSQFVDLFEKKVKGEFRSGGSDTRKVVEEIKRDLKKYFGTDASCELKESRYIGPVSRKKNAFITASMMAVEAVGKNIPVYNITALVRVKIAYFSFTSMQISGPKMTSTGSMQRLRKR